MYSVLAGSSGRQSEGLDASRICCMVGAGFFGASTANAAPVASNKPSASIEVFIVRSRDDRSGIIPSRRVRVFHDPFDRHRQVASRVHRGVLREYAPRLGQPRVVRRIHEQEGAAFAREIGVVAQVAGFGAGEFRQPRLHAFKPALSVPRFQLSDHELATGRAHVLHGKTLLAERGFRRLGFVETAITRDDVVARIENAERVIAFLEERPVLGHGACPPCGEDSFDHPSRCALGWRESHFTGIPGCAPSSTPSRNNWSPPAPAERIMPSLMPKRILRGARLAMNTTCRPTSSAGSGYAALMPEKICRLPSSPASNSKRSSLSEPSTCSHLRTLPTRRSSFAKSSMETVSGLGTRDSGLGGAEAEAGSGERGAEEPG